MNILVACEESQRVTIELRKLNHTAFSCDIIEQSGGHPEWHIQQDVLTILNPTIYGVDFKTTDGQLHHIDKWDMIIAFPPCTYLTCAGNRWFNVGKYGDKARKRIENRELGKQFFMEFVNANCDKIAIENPIGIMSTQYRKPDQIIQPYQFGEPYAKSTCLWLKNLPKLVPTDIIPMPKEGWKNAHMINGKYRGFKNYDENGKILAWNDPKTAIVRSKTYLGIAKAMATQWTKGDN